MHHLSADIGTLGMFIFIFKYFQFQATEFAPAQYVTGYRFEDSKSNVSFKVFNNYLEKREKCNLTGCCVCCIYLYVCLITNSNFKASATLISIIHNDCDL
jgi:hypothetical protein